MPPALLLIAHKLGDGTVQRGADALENIAIVADNFVFVVVIDNGVADTGAFGQFIAADIAAFQQFVQRKINLSHTAPLLLHICVLNIPIYAHSIKLYIGLTIYLMRYIVTREYI